MKDTRTILASTKARGLVLEIVSPRRCCLLWICLSVAIVGCAAPKQATKSMAPRFSAASPTQDYQASWIGLYEGETDLHQLKVDRRHEDLDFALNIEYADPNIIVTGWVRHDADEQFSPEGAEDWSFSFAAPVDDPLEISGSFTGPGPRGDRDSVECSLSRAGHIIRGNIRSFRISEADGLPLHSADFSFKVMLSDVEPKRLHSR